MPEPTFENVASFVQERLWSPRGGVKRTTDLREDIGLAGVEAVSFMYDFAEEFGVDMSNFQFDEYFEREANPLLLPIGIVWSLYLYLFDPDRLRSSFQSITVGDLVRAAKNGEWSPNQDSDEN